MSGGSAGARRADAATHPAAAELDALRLRFGANVSLARRRAALSKERVAERAGLHPSQLDLVRRGRRLPRLDTIVRLGGALEVEPFELVAGMAWRPAGQGDDQGWFEVEPMDGVERSRWTAKR